MTNAEFTRAYNRIIEEMPLNVAEVERTFEENLECYGTCIPAEHWLLIPVEGKVETKRVYTSKG